MPYTITVRETKHLPATGVADSAQIYEQTVEALDLAKLLAAVNYRPRVRKPRNSTLPSK